MSNDDLTRSTGQPPNDVDAIGTTSLAEAIETLDPAYFGFVMSTGIVSIAFRELGVMAVAWPLAILTVGCYALLLILFAIRSLLHPGQMAADLRDSTRHWGTLTFIVATNTVGVQSLFFFEAVGPAIALWLTTVFATPLFLYYLFTVEFIGPQRLKVSERIDGAILLVIVCMQSLAILGGLLSDATADFSKSIILLSMSYFGAGYVLYFVVVTIVTYRLLDGRLEPGDWTGPYWITMGAAAITTLAGATLGPRLETIPIWEPYAPVIIGVTFLAWAIASWWIPLLIVIDVWKFATEDLTGRRTPTWVLVVPWSRLGFGRSLHTYAPTAWGRVFPMGMYTACTLNLAGVSTFSLLAVVPAYWGWFALLVWLLTFLGTVRAVASVLLQESSFTTGAFEAS